jgi:DNA repair exonuclease SbcCD ATPase subunit
MQLSASDRRSIIEDLLDIQIFSTMNGLVKDKLSVNKEETSSKKYEIDLTQQKYDLQKLHLDQLKQNNEDKVKEYENEIQCHSNTISTLLSNVATLTTKTEELQLVVTDKAETETKIKKITKIESQIESNLSKFRKDIGFFQSHDNCPTCRQTIAMDFKEEELVALGTKVSECEHGLIQLEQKLNLEQQKLNFIADKQKELHAVQIEIARLNTSIDQTQKYITKIQTDLQHLMVTKGSTGTLEQQLQEVLDSLTKQQQELKTLIETKAYYEVASSLLKDTGIKTKIIKQYLPIINKLVNKYLSSLDFFVNFNLDESFKETIKSRFRDEFSYHNFSEGEKQRIDMALMLTWRAVAKLKNSANTNLLILDETFDSSLDANGTEELMKILHLLEGVNLFVISHKGDILQDKFMNVIRFTKEKNFSRIVK